MKKKNAVTRSDAIATIGFDGEAALVDGSSRRQLASLTTDQLIEAGFFRSAAVSALMAHSTDELTRVAEAYNRIAGTRYSSDSIPRLFGVAAVSAPRVLVL